MFLQVSRLIAMVFAVGALVGCGESDKWAEERPTPVPVSGTVLHKGQPVPDATVIFVPSGHNHAATGRTDTEGRFELQTFAPSDGAVPGQYKVSVRKVEVNAGAAGAAQDDVEAPEPVERSLLPVQYANAELSGLTASVEEGGENDFTFELADGPRSTTGGAAPVRSLGE